MLLANSGRLNSPQAALPWHSQLGRIAAAATREVFAFVHTAANLRSELRRMADECEATRPDQARQLREVADSTNWGE